MNPIGDGNGHGNAHRNAVAGGAVGGSARGCGAGDGAGREVRRGPAARRRRSGRLGVVAVLAAALILGGATAASADSRSTAIAKDGGLGFGAAMATLVYAPIKLVYAAGGLVVGGLAWAFSGGDSEVAAVVFTPSLRGDYVVTPDHLNGKKRFEFFGRDARGNSMEDRTNVASAPESWSSGW